ncbi:hypothetical protein [Mumia sp.]|uniref:hypothetical protein n=1 Tax=Mumia sp. TaxID=1965300 RepID=UPI002619D5DA|nr:hypothetical protein [Mumia sp.]MDD9347421.1 hypothetical protein [Mumia sp.]
MTADAVTLLPWAALLSAIAVFFAWRAWKAGDRAAVVRRVGWALVPWALWLVGALKLVVRIGSAVADWAAGFVFRPSVWLGIALAIVAVLLIVAGSRGRGKSRAVEGGAPTRDAPAVEAAPSARRKKGSPKKGGATAQDDDLAEIEDILRRHGIE